VSTNHETQKKNIPFGGILLILGGLILLLQQLADFEITGGVFLAGLGLFFILWGATTRKTGLLIPGGIMTGISVGVFLVEDVHTIAEYAEGGVFVLALAAGFALVTVLTQIFTPEKNWWALIVSSVLALVGGGILIVESPNASDLKPMVESLFNASQYFWPLVLVALGLWIIFKKKEG
jgi:hypothetical protein